MKSIVYVGIDVHKATFSACCYVPAGNCYFAEQTFESSTEKIVLHQLRCIGLFGKNVQDGVGLKILSNKQAQEIGKAGIKCYISIAQSPLTLQVLCSLLQRMGV